MITAKIYVTLKPGILDPQGKTIHHALENLGIESIHEVRMGKLIEMKFEGISGQDAQERTEKACKQLLANPVIENYRIELVNDELQKDIK